MPLTPDASEKVALPRAVTDESWLSFVEGQRNATPFHHPAWAKVIAECYGYRPFALVVTGDHGGVLSGLPVIEVRRPIGKPQWVSLPFTDYCSPLGGDALTQWTTVAALDAARRHAGVFRLEVRCSLGGEAAFTTARSYGHTLPLHVNEDELFATFHRNQVQRNVRRARREGVQVRFSAGENDLIQTFFRLHVLTRRRLGVPVQPLKYFRVLWRRMIKANLGFVAIASLDGSPIAAAVFLTFNGTIIYKYGASDANYWSARANHLLFWEAIRWGCTHGYHTFDFGRTGLNDGGLRDFKARWGTIERAIVYTTIADEAPPSSREEVPVLVRAVIRRTPSVVARALGTALYRFTA